MKKYIQFSLIVITILLTCYSCSSQTVVVRKPRRTVVVKTPQRVVVAPPVRRTVVYRAPVVVRTVPSHWVTVYYNEIPYYYADGVYYIPNKTKDEYLPVPPKIGTIVPSLPTEASKKTIEGNIYYEYQDILYKKISIEGVDKYEVVSTYEE